MNKIVRLKTSATLALALLAVSLPASAVVYTFDRAFDGGTATGTITTSGVGLLGAGDFTAWNIILSRGADTFVLTESNSVIDLGDLAPTIEATTSSLIITLASEAELSSAGADSSQFYVGTGGPTGTFYTLVRQTGFPMGYDLGEAIRLSASNQALYNSASDILVLNAQSSGGTVPSPSSLSLMGVGLLGWLRHRRAK